MSALTNPYSPWTTIECYRCACLFQVPTQWNKNRIDDRTDWYCPNGHIQHYLGETEAEKLRKQLADEQAKTAEAERKRAWAEAKAKTVANKMKRLERRVSAGVCPCCQRTVSQLAKHIASKHPEFAKKAGGKADAP